MEEALLKKLDARARARMAQEVVQGPFEIFVRLSDPPSTEQQAQLQQAGYTLRSLAGTIATGSAPDIAALERIALLPFVRAIEVTRGLYPE